MLNIYYQNRKSKINIYITLTNSGQIYDKNCKKYKSKDIKIKIKKLEEVVGLEPTHVGFAIRGITSFAIPPTNAEPINQQ